MLDYAVVTPARDEARNLRRLARCLAGQSVTPAAWVIVDNGSTDGTRELAEALAAEHPWVHAVEAPPVAGLERGGPIVRAFNVGLASVPASAGVVVKLDADVSVGRGYFERLVQAFDADPRLGIAGGSARERADGGAWTLRATSGTTVWGASRAYRRACLDDVTPLEERMGWDGIDELKAKTLGWRTRTLLDLPFRHHRAEGGRDASAWASWSVRGRAARYMGYRPSYLVLRGLRRAAREPASLGLVTGYLRSALRREPQCADLEVRALLRSQQRWRHLATRARETGKNAGPGRLDVLLVCSGGGHLLQLWSLKRAWEDRRRSWVVVSFEQSDVRSLLRGEDVVFAYAPTVRNVKNLVRNVLLARRVVRRERPRVIITTGSAVAVPFAWVGRLYGVRTVYVESLARTTAPSLSCRLASPVVDRVYVQWPELQPEIRGALYRGTVFATE